MAKIDPDDIATPGPRIWTQQDRADASYGVRATQAVRSAAPKVSGKTDTRSPTEKLAALAASKRAKNKLRQYQPTRSLGDARYAPQRTEIVPAATPAVFLLADRVAKSESVASTVVPTKCRKAPYIRPHMAVSSTAVRGSSGNTDHATAYHAVAQADRNRDAGR